MMALRKDEKGVSPVIGVILMVAITVILAAVIASFVFGLTGTVPKQKTPGITATRLNSTGFELVLRDWGGATNISGCSLKNVSTGEDAITEGSGSFSKVGDSITCSDGTCGPGLFRLICDVDGNRQVVWEGRI
jgi:flagellin-like protein